DRGALLEALLEFWSREMTDAEFERIQSLRGGDTGGELRARLLALAEDVLEKGMGRYDPAIRAWGRSDRKVAAAVAQVDRRRVRALTALFEEGGFGAAQARTRARTFYTFLLGEPQVRAPVRAPAARRAGTYRRSVRGCAPGQRRIRLPRTAPSARARAGGRPARPQPPPCGRCAPRRGSPDRSGPCPSPERPRRVPAGARAVPLLCRRRASSGCARTRRRSSRATRIPAALRAARRGRGSGDRSCPW